MNNEIKVLDKGFVRLLNISGAIPRKEVEVYPVGEEEYYREITRNVPFDSRDIDPALVARSSFGKSFEQRATSIDEGLVEYLIRNQHTTPLEFTTITLQFKMPIFCARQFIRHRTGDPLENNDGNEPTVNEISGRYVQLPADWYIPEVVRGKHSGGNKQGSEDNLKLENQEQFKRGLNWVCEKSYEAYLLALEDGVCPEQARMFLHLNHYTEFVWKQDLHNLMHLLSLRLDEHAQWETRQFAEAIYELLCYHLPKSMEWFDTYRRKLSIDEQVLLFDTICTMNMLDLPEDKIKLLEKLAERNGIKL